MDIQTIKKLQQLSIKASSPKKEEEIAVEDENDIYEKTLRNISDFSNALGSSLGSIHGEEFGSNYSSELAKYLTLVQDITMNYFRIKFLKGEQRNLETRETLKSNFNDLNNLNLSIPVSKDSDSNLRSQFNELTVKYMKLRGDYKKLSDTKSNLSPVKTLETQEKMTTYESENKVLKASVDLLTKKLNDATKTISELEEERSKNQESTSLIESLKVKIESLKNELNETKTKPTEHKAEEVKETNINSSEEENDKPTVIRREATNPNVERARKRANKLRNTSDSDKKSIKTDTSSGSKTFRINEKQEIIEIIREEEKRVAEENQEREQEKLEEVSLISDPVVENNSVSYEHLEKENKELKEKLVLMKRLIRSIPRRGKK